MQRGFLFGGTKHVLGRACNGKSGVAFVSQIVLHLAQKGLQLPAPDAQGYAGRQDVDDHQVQKAGDHGAVFIKAFRVVCA